jgi:hypothetical protein
MQTGESVLRILGNGVLGDHPDDRGQVMATPAVVGWLAARPALTALAVVGCSSELYLDATGYIRRCRPLAMRWDAM